MLHQGKLIVTAFGRKGGPRDNNTQAHEIKSPCSSSRLHPHNSTTPDTRRTSHVKLSAQNCPVLLSFEIVENKGWNK